MSECHIVIISAIITYMTVVVVLNCIMISILEFYQGLHRVFNAWVGRAKRAVTDYVAREQGDTKRRRVSCSRALGAGGGRSPWKNFSKIEGF